jgi:hypothetical protein
MRVKREFECFNTGNSTVLVREYSKNELIYFRIFRNTLEKQGATIAKSMYQLPKLISLFLDTTKNDPDFNSPSFRLELTHLKDQFPIIGQFYYELYEANPFNSKLTLFFI